MVRCLPLYIVQLDSVLLGGTRNPRRLSLARVNGFNRKRSILTPLDHPRNLTRAHRGSLIRGWAGAPGTTPYARRRKCGVEYLGKSHVDLVALATKRSFSVRHGPNRWIGLKEQ
jgi:hypothetical protein